MAVFLVLLFLSFFFFLSSFLFGACGLGLLALTGSQLTSEIF
jgi:hypothetical protein